MGDCIDREEKETAMSDRKILRFNEDGHVVWMTIQEEYDMLHKGEVNTRDAFILRFNDDGHVVWVENPNYNDSKRDNNESTN
jgi:hypothetical protein